MALTSIEICAGGGGQALGLEHAGFNHLVLLEIERHSCATLRSNRRYWNTVQDDIKKSHAAQWRGRVDLLAGGVPCPPFSNAGKQLGADDDRDLFPHAVRLIRGQKEYFDLDHQEQSARRSVGPALAE
jgi:DNA (cytosine-5)-methyltransferase 1